MKPRYFKLSPTGSEVKEISQNDHTFLRLKDKMPRGFTINSIVQNYQKKLWDKFCYEYKRLELRGSKTSRSLMYHLTTESNAKEILRNGFSFKNSKLRAFGKGVNLAPSIEEVVKYKILYPSKRQTYSILVCEVLTGNSHGNHSDDNVVVRTKCGSFYSKPQFMKPKVGYDSMYSLQPLKKIWVIPDPKRVYPSFLMTIK
jgi:hypothetical protein